MNKTTKAEVLETRDQLTERRVNEALSVYADDARGVSTARIKELAELAKGLTIDGIEDTRGFDQVSSVRKTVKAIRVQVERTRVELKADALVYGRAVDGEANRLKALLMEIEAPLQTEQKRITDERIRVRQEEAQRQRELFKKRLLKLQSVDAFNQPSGKDVMPTDIQEWDDEQYKVFLDAVTGEALAAEEERAAAAHAVKVAKEKEEAEEKKRREAQAKKDAAAKAKEDARLAKVKAEQDKEAARLKKQREELDAEKAANQAILDSIKKAQDEAEAARVAALTPEPAPEVVDEPKDEDKAVLESKEPVDAKDAKPPAELFEETMLGHDARVIEELAEAIDLIELSTPLNDPVLANKVVETLEEAAQSLRALKPKA